MCFTYRAFTFSHLLHYVGNLSQPFPASSSGIPCAQKDCLVGKYPATVIITIALTATEHLLGNQQPEPVDYTNNSNRPNQSLWKSTESHILI